MSGQVRLLYEINSATHRSLSTHVSVKRGCNVCFYPTNGPLTAGCGGDPERVHGLSGRSGALVASTQ